LASPPARERGVQEQEEAMDDMSIYEEAYQRDLALLAEKKALAIKQPLDELENLILSAGGCAKVARLFPAGADAQLQQIDELLGEMLTRVLALKKHLNISSSLTLIEQEDK
jgi:hypothetical protein